MWSEPSVDHPETRRHTLSGGHTLVADHWGPPSDDAVLFLHGGGQTRHSWGGTAKAMAAAGRYAITLDMRGHGESDWTEEGAYQLSTFADDAAEVIRSLGIKPALVGASLGGMTGVLLEGDRHQGSISALVLVDIIPKMNPAGADRVKEFMLANAEVRLCQPRRCGGCRLGLQPPPATAVGPGRAQEEPPVPRGPLVLALGSALHRVGDERTDPRGPAIPS